MKASSQAALIQPNLSLKKPFSAALHRDTFRVTETKPGPQPRDLVLGQCCSWDPEVSDQCETGAARGGIDQQAD